MKPVIKKEDGTVVEMKDVKPGEKVVMSMSRPSKMMRAMAQSEEPPVADSIELGTFTLDKAVNKTPGEVHAASALTPEQIRARIAAWRERNPEKSEQQLAQAAAFVRANRGT